MGFFIMAVLLVLSSGYSHAARAAQAAGLTSNCSALSVDSGAADAGLNLNGFLNDQYKWYDGACRLRSVALARNDSSKGGNAKQFTYVLADGTTRTINPGANGAAGFGYVVAHLSNPSFARSYGAGDSPLGSGNSATHTKLFTGENHAIHEYTLNYVRYGLTQEAITGGFAPWTWINGPGDPNRQYVKAYTMPVRIQWMFATGRDYPIWSVTFDLSAAPDHAIDSDFRAPYGDMKIEGGDGTDLVGGVSWGDKYRFATSGNPFTMNNDWDYAQLNQGAPYGSVWTSTIDAEMGLAGTQLAAQQNAGGYNNWQAPIWRGKTGATMGQLCLNDRGAGPGYDHKLPCTSDWAYQLIQYSIANASQTTSNKRMAWGADWGSLGNSSFISSNGYAVSGYPKVSYSVYIVLDPHSKNPTQNMALQAKTISLTTLAATLGTVRTRGSAGVGRTDIKPYSPVGFSPVFGTWEVDAVNNEVNLLFSVSNLAPSALDAPVIVVHNYTGTIPTAQVLLDGAALKANSDYFLSLRPGASELWVTLNRKISGAHNFQIVNSITGVTLSVAKTGAGSGAIASSPAGINCCSTCSARFNSGTPVTLTAMPAPGFTFTGWSGACSGTSTSCTVTMDAAKAVAAAFTTFPATLSPSGISASAAGLIGTVSVTAGTEGTWTAISNTGWITVTSGSGGSGPVVYSVAANTGAHSRTGTLTIAGMTFTVTQAGASALIGPAGIAAWDALPAGEKLKVRTTIQSFFLHQSVGGDLEDGADAGGYRFEYADSGATRLATGLNGGLFSSSNGDPAGKIEEFRAMATANSGTVKVAIMKFGYADIAGNTLALVQPDYLAAVNAIKAQGVRVLHVTPPLVYNAPTENAPKMQMRAWMIDTFPNDAVFDLGDIESTDPATGARCQRGGSWEICDRVRSTAACPSLNQGIDAASGQGHLCHAPHAQRFAKAFLYAIYRAAGSSSVALALPAAPAIGIAMRGNASARVAFTPGAIGAGKLLKYTAQCGNRTATGVSPIMVSGLINGATYTCRVRTTSTAGVGPWSAFSNPVSPSAALTLPAAPAIGTAMRGNASARIAFTPGAIGAGKLLNYTAQCGNRTATGASPIMVPGLINGATYTCRVKTTSTAGIGPWSAFSNPVSPSAALALSTSHPRLWLTAADLPRLRTWATDSNPLYRNGLKVLAARAKADMDRGDVARDCGTREWEEFPTEMYAELFAFMSLVESDVATRSDYAARARTLLMNAINQAAQGPATARNHACGYPPFRDPEFFTTDSNRARWHGEAFPLVVDWIYPSLSSRDKQAIRTVFLRWSQEIIAKGYHHPAPVGMLNSTSLLNKPQVRWSGNNYFTAHMRNLGMMAMAMDASDDAGNRLRNNLGNATGAWLYIFDHLTRTDSKGGLLPEGFEYSPQTASYAAQFLLALRTAGADSCGAHCRLSANPFWDDFVTAYYHSLSPATIADPDSGGTAYLPASYGDAQNYRTPDFIDSFGAIGIYDTLSNNASRLNALRWAQLNTAPGGATAFNQRVSNSDDFRHSLLYFMLYNPSAGTASDPRTGMALSHFAPGMNKILVRTGWDTQASWFTYTLGWNFIDHQTADGNHFGWYRRGEWLTKARSGYPDIAEGIGSSEFYNTIALQNSPPDRGASDWRTDLWRRGSQWNYVAAGSPTLLARSDQPGFTYAMGDATHLYNSSSEGAADIVHASRSIVWLKQDDAVVVYDRGQSTAANRFKRWWLQLANPATVSGKRATSITPGGQRLTVTSLLPNAATLSAIGSPGEPIEGQVAQGEPMKVRLRIEAGGNPASVRFLNVLQASNAGRSQSAVATVQNAAMTWSGAQAGTTVVMFPVNAGQAFDGLSYTTATPATTHIITGLPPNSGYTARRSGNTVSVQAGGNQMSDSGGVLELR